MSAALPEWKTLERVVHRLDEVPIPYMLTGSFALSFYGPVRATNDLDIVIQMGHSDAGTMYRLFEEGFYVSPEAIEQALTRLGSFNVIDHESMFKVDFILHKDDAYSRARFARRRFFKVGSLSLSVISPEDLVLGKLVWSLESRSALQESDVMQLLSKATVAWDLGYLYQWAEVLKVRKRLDELYGKMRHQS